MTRAEFDKPTKRQALKRSGKLCEAVGPMYGLEPGQRCNIPSAIRGAAALQEALDLIGNTDTEQQGDKLVAKIIVDNELALRDMLRQFLTGLAEEL